MPGPLNEFLKEQRAITKRCLRLRRGSSEILINFLQWKLRNSGCAFILGEFIFKHLY